LDQVEHIIGVIITPEPFSEENLCMTSTKKMRRVEIKRKFKRELDDLYSKLENHKPIELKPMTIS
jgi:long-subunit acyl-CoA synthetase (AMP-forming)